MSDLVENLEDWFSHVVAHNEDDDKGGYNNDYNDNDENDYGYENSNNNDNFDSQCISKIIIFINFK